MPEKRTVQRARRDLRQGKSASTAAGEFVKETIEHIREGKHGAKNAKQAIAIGLSKARRAGVPLPPRNGEKPSKPHRANPRRSRAAARALKRKPRRAASHLALSRQAHRTARRRKAARSRNA